jgi:hypothetical protein
MSLVARLVVGPLLAGVVVLQSAAPAAADVVIDSVVPRGDGSVDLVFALSRGCAGAPTEGLVATLPTGAAVVAVEDPDGWSHEVEGGRISWAGPVIPAVDEARFSVTARIGAAPGDTVLVPVEQACAGGARVSWTGPLDDVETPSPGFVATASTVDPSLQAVPTFAEPDGAGPVSVALAVLAAIGLAVGAAVVRRRVTPGRPPRPGRRPMRWR